MLWLVFVYGRIPKFITCELVHHHELRHGVRSLVATCMKQQCTMGHGSNFTVWGKNCMGIKMGRKKAIKGGIGRP